MTYTRTFTLISSSLPKNKAYIPAILSGSRLFLRFDIEVCLGDFGYSNTASILAATADGL